MSSALPEPERRLVGYITRDLFFGVRIAEGLKRLGLPGEQLSPNGEGGELRHYVLLILDLSLPEDRWLPLIERARAAGLPVLAFGSHLDGARWQRARVAGATRIVANSQLAEHLPELVQRLLRPLAGPTAEEPASPD